MRLLLLGPILALAIQASALSLDCHYDLAVTSGQSPSNDDFKPIHAHQNAFGFSNQVHWLRVACNDAPLVQPIYLEIDYPHLDDLQIFSNLDLDHPLYHAGDRLPFSSRPVLIPQFAFPIDSFTLSEGLVVRVETTSSVQVPLFIRTETELLEHHTKTHLAQGLYFGLILAMIILNFWLFALMREGVVARYLAYLSSFALLQLSMNGWISAYLAPNSPAAANLILPASVWLTFATMFEFSRSFLRTELYACRLDRILLALRWFCLGFVALSFVAPYATVIRPAVIFGMISVPLLFGVSLWISRAYSAAYFFIAAWTVFLLGTLLLNLKNLGLLPSNSWTDFSAQWGSALQILFLSAGVSFRLRVREQERRVADLSRRVAHDIRAPLSALKVASSTLPVAASAQGELLKLAIHRIMEISEDLLHGKPPERPAERMSVQLRATLASVASEANALAMERCWSGQIEWPQFESDIWIQVDSSDFKRALINTVVNAMEAQSTRIQVRFTHTESEAILDIQDNGHGIESTLLNPLRSGHQITTKSKGSGLGLSSAQSTIQAAGGQLLIDSRLGQGTCIRMILPLVTTVAHTQEVRQNFFSQS